MLETVKGRAPLATVLILLGFGLGMIYVASSSVASSVWPEGYTGFEFEVVGDAGDYVIVKVTKVHGLARATILVPARVILARK
ncbi:MAG: hypothetical protein AOA65_1071 [Candidatus Bathyarchaeota archaeon BA1]|nr:MAG: hypothetical protein AOA65_1071 [Candidatus Bathyarchaeota archaeon BA1]